MSLARSQSTDSPRLHRQSQGGPLVEQEGSPVRLGGPPVEQEGTLVRLGGPPVEQEGPPAEKVGTLVEHGGPFVGLEGPFGALDCRLGRRAGASGSYPTGSAPPNRRS